MRYYEMSDGFLAHRFDVLDPETHKELSRRGGIVSGQRRRSMAEARDMFNDGLILYAMRDETREHFKAAIRKYAAEERRKRKRRKPRPDDT